MALSGIKSIVADRHSGVQWFSGPVPILTAEVLGGTAPVDLLGIVLAAFGGLTYAVYSMIGGRLIAHGHSSNAVMGMMFGIAGLLVLPVVLCADTSWLHTGRGIAVALHLAVF